MIVLIVVLIIGFILIYTYIEIDRAEIQRKQEALHKAQDALDARLKEQERLRHEESLKRSYDAEV